jgi:hypothetical protein
MGRLCLHLPGYPQVVSLLTLVTWLYVTGHDLSCLWHLRSSRYQVVVEPEPVCLWRHKRQYYHQAFPGESLFRFRGNGRRDSKVHHSHVYVFCSPTVPRCTRRAVQYIPWSHLAIYWIPISFAVIHRRQVRYPHPGTE